VRKGEGSERRVAKKVWTVGKDFGRGRHWQKQVSLGGKSFGGAWKEGGLRVKVAKKNGENR